MSDPKHEGLPVEGYKPQGAAAVLLVNANKQIEEQILTALDGLAELGWIDKRWLAIGRTEIEKGFMAVNRAIFQPDRAKPWTEDERTAFADMLEQLQRAAASDSGGAA